MKRVVMVLAIASCGGGTKQMPPETKPMGKMDSMMTEGGGLAGDDHSAYGELEIGADWQTYAKLNKASFKSETHGGRMVDTYANSVALEAFKQGEDMPVGSIVVKTSKGDDGSEGPVFVMEKRAAGFNKDHGDWWFAIHWADPPDKWKTKLGGPIYWRTPSQKAMYCANCHDDFVTGIGGVPDEHKSW